MALREPRRYGVHPDQLLNWDWEEQRKQEFCQIGEA